ncbi:MAG: N-acetyltransferase family protein [Phycisphaerales bacterium]
MRERFRPRVIRLRDGREATLRKVSVRDAKGCGEMDRALAEDGRGVVWDAGQLPAGLPEMRARLQKWTGLPLREGLMVVATVKGKVAGEGKIRRFKPSKVRHVAHLSLGVHPAYQGVGLGRAIMGAMLEWARWTGESADEDQGVSRVTLDVFAENVRARRLYESLGFELEGVRRGQLREADGREHDDLLMALMLHGNKVGG